VLDFDLPALALRAGQRTSATWVAIHAELQQLDNGVGVTSFFCGELAGPPERMAGWPVGVSGLLSPAADRNRLRGRPDSQAKRANYDFPDWE
jgi:hypothetical protein